MPPVSTLPGAATRGMSNPPVSIPSCHYRYAHRSTKRDCKSATYFNLTTMILHGTQQVKPETVRAPHEVVDSVLAQLEPHEAWAVTTEPEQELERARLERRQRARLERRQRRGLQRGQGARLRRG